MKQTLIIKAIFQHECFNVNVSLFQFRCCFQCHALFFDREGIVILILYIR